MNPLLLVLFTAVVTGSVHLLTFGTRVDPWRRDELTVPWRQRAWMLTFCVAFMWPACVMISYTFGGAAWYASLHFECEQEPAVCICQCEEPD